MCGLTAITAVKVVDFLVAHAFIKVQSMILQHLQYFMHNNLKVISALYDQMLMYCNQPLAMEKRCGYTKIRRGCTVNTCAPLCTWKWHTALVTLWAMLWLVGLS